MTAQEIFDKSAYHLLAQGARSTQKYAVRRGDKWATGERCAYRGLEGRKCAVGAVMSDAAYSEVLEGQSVVREGVTMALEASGVEVVENLGLLAALQDVHDCHEPQDWAQALREVAAERGLEVRS